MDVRKAIKRKKRRRAVRDFLDRHGMKMVLDSAVIVVAAGITAVIYAARKGGEGVEPKAVQQRGKHF